MDKLLIIDGHNLLFQMFYGMPTRIVNANGKAIQGTLGFVGAMLKIIKMTSPTHMAVFFDGEHENPRAEIRPEYKANRPDHSQIPEEDSPFSQLPDVYAALDYLHIKHTEIEELEADDVIANYALTYGRDIQIVISSFDSDFFQLVTETVSVLRYRGNHTTICDTAYVTNRYGVPPAAYADFKALTGDTADNIKGADKVGPKTAAALLAEWGTLDGILHNRGQITKPSIKESITHNAERLHQNYQLIKLNNQAPMPFALTELAYTFGGQTTTEVLKGINLK